MIINNSDQLKSFSEEARFRWNFLLDCLLDRDDDTDDTIKVNETNESAEDKEVELGKFIKYFLIGLLIGSIGGYLVLWNV